MDSYMVAPMGVKLSGVVAYWWICDHGRFRTPRGPSNGPGGLFQVQRRLAPRNTVGAARARERERGGRYKQV